MDNKIINLEKYVKENTPHSTGKARCLVCGYKCILVLPIGELWSTCPKCKTEKLTFIYPIEHSKPHYRCNCGNSLFYVTPEFIYCGNCGQTQMEHGK